MDLLVFGVSVVVIIIVVVATIIVMSIVANFMDFCCCPSNLHICFPPFVVPPQALETRYHSPSGSFAFCSLIYIFYENNICDALAFYLPLVLMLALHMVPLSLSSSCGPLLLCSPTIFCP